MEPIHKILNLIAWIWGITSDTQYQDTSGFMDTTFLRLKKIETWSCSDNPKEYTDYHSTSLSYATFTQERIIDGFPFMMWLELDHHGLYREPVREIPATKVPVDSKRFMLTANVTLASSVSLKLPYGIRWSQLFRPPFEIDLLPLGTQLTSPLSLPAPLDLPLTPPPLLLVTPITYVVRGQLVYSNETRDQLKVTRQYIELHYVTYHLNHTNFVTKVKPYVVKNKYYPYLRKADPNQNRNLKNKIQGHKEQSGNAIPHGK